MSAIIMTGYHTNMGEKPSSKKSCRFCFFFFCFNDALFNLGILIYGISTRTVAVL